MRSVGGWYDHDVEASDSGDESLRRRLFQLLCALSLIVCLATSIVWCRSWWRDDYCQSLVRTDDDLFQYTVESVRGTIDITITRLPYRTATGPISRQILLPTRGWTW